MITRKLLSQFIFSSDRWRRVVDDSVLPIKGIAKVFGLPTFRKTNGRN
ncbi:hypothetical protein LC653_24975 [Nostoc sp. CHAB 5784]|nr:hypothetical protein [Nostoc mirabile CHAB5784]